MSKKDKPNFTELAHQVVHQSRTPLAFDEIMRRVHAIIPITTKNPSATIRSAVSQSRLIVSTGDGCYGWMPRVMSGSYLRLTLSKSDLKGEAITLSEEAREALWPTFFEIEKRSDRAPVHLQLPDGTVAEFPLEHLRKVGDATWGSSASPEFWKWFNGLNAEMGDHLILQVLDGEARFYGVAFQRRVDRDEQVIAERNHALLQAASAHLTSRPYGAAIWDTAAHLLATGACKHPVAPDPLEEIWTKEIWGPIVAQKKRRSGWVRVEDEASDEDAAHALSQQLYGDVSPHPADLPMEYRSEYGRRTRPSLKAQKGAVKTYTLRVNHRALPEVWRDIEIAEDQTLEDLHLTIQKAYKWSDDHLYSFFMDGEAWNKQSEIGSPWSEAPQSTHRATIDSLGLRARRKFLYLFDYGDNHEFDVTVLKINPVAAAAQYPRIVAKQGKAPPQYQDYDEETGETEWDPYRHWDASGRS